MDGYLKHSLDYTFGEIRDSDGKHYEMANEELADKMFPHIKTAYPDAVMIKNGIVQYIAVSEREKLHLIATLNGHIEEYKQRISSLNAAIAAIGLAQRDRKTDTRIQEMER